MRAAMNRWLKIAFPRWRVGLVGVVVAVLLFGNGCNPPPSTPPKTNPGTKEPNPKSNPKPPQREPG
jgi:hypothetical protein